MMTEVSQLVLAGALVVAARGRHRYAVAIIGALAP
jgi:hypothetical protein